MKKGRAAMVRPVSKIKWKKGKGYGPTLNESIYLDWGVAQHGPRPVAIVLIERGGARAARPNQIY